MTRGLPTPLGTFATVAFVVCLGVHLASFLPGSSVEIGSAFVLFPVAMFTMGSIIVVVYRLSSRLAKLGVTDRDLIMREAPPAVKAAMIGILLYAVINFLGNMYRLGEGMPRRVDGAPVLENRGKVVRKLTEAEYKRLSAIEARAFSGHLLLFTLWPTLFFWAIEPRLRREVDELTESPDVRAGHAS